MAETSNNQKSLKPEQVSEQSINDILLELQATEQIPARTYNAAIKAIKDPKAGAANRTEITKLTKQLVETITAGSPETKKYIESINKLTGMVVIPVEDGEQAPELIGTTTAEEDGTIVQDITDSTNQEISKLLGLMMSLKHNRWEKLSDRPALVASLNKRLEKNVKELQVLQETEKRVNKPLEDLLDSLVEQKKITAKQKKQLRALHPNQSDYRKDIVRILGGLTIQGDQVTVDKISRTLTEGADERRKIGESLREKIVEYRKIMDEIGEDINAEANRHGELLRLERYLGFTIKADKKLRIKQRRKLLEKKPIQGGRTIWVEKTDVNGNSLYENIYQTVTIKRVWYQDFHYTDENGKPVKVPNNQPMVEVEYIDETPDERGIKNKRTFEHPAADLKKIADEDEMTEIITPDNNSEDPTSEIEQLTQLIGEEIKEGDTLEYTQKDVSRPSSPGRPKTVQVIRFSKKQDDHDPTNKKTYIELSNPVITAAEPTSQLKNVLSLEEFARWYKRLDASHEMDITALRQKLQQEFAQRVQDYPDRDPNQYPPINAEEGELLYYDNGDEDPPTFLVKKVSDEGIELSNKEVLTPAAFYKWVKNNNVEKQTAASEAHKVAALIEDPEEKVKVQELEEEIQAKKLAEKKLQHDIDNAVLPSTTLTSPQSVSVLRKIYNETYFLSGGNLYEIGKEIYDYILRYMERTGKERVGNAGDMMLSPIHRQLGAEFQTLATSAETTNVNRYKEQYSSFGVIQLYDRLKGTNSKDELKAILYTLADKGAIRWEDQTVINAINRIGATQPNYTHIPKYDEELLAKNLDRFWGEQTFNELKTKNNSAYGSTKSSFQEEARRLENDPEHKGGLAVKMREMLYLHMKGEWVDPAEYEGYLHYAIQMGKFTFPDKVFFIFMGLGAMSPPGGAYSSKPLLNFARVSDMEGQLLNNFPIIDFFTTSKVQQYNKDLKMLKNDKGELMKNTMNINYVHKIIEDYIKNELGEIDSPAKLEAPAGFIEYVERDMLMNEDVIVRMTQKAGTNMTQWDHDDFHMFGSRLGESQMELLAAPGAARQASVAAVKNTFAGMNHYTNIFMEEFIKAQATGDKAQADKNLANMVNTLRSFVRLDAILDTRYLHTQYDRMRLTNELNDYAGVDGAQGPGKRTIRTYNNEMKNFIGGMIDQMQQIDPSLLKSINANPDFFQKLDDQWTIVNSHYGATQRGKQDEQQEAVKDFGRDFSQALGIIQKALGNAAIVDMINNVQYGNQGKLIKGIGQTAKVKAEESEASTPTQLEKVDATILKTQADQIESLRQELTRSGTQSVAEIEAAKDARTESILEAIRQGKTDGLSTEDSDLLNRKIDELQMQIHQKENPPQSS